jgi:hypothetical protein
MNFLEERILQDGKVKSGNVLKVDRFLNHQLDIGLLEQIGAQVGSLVEDHVDTTLSLGKVFWTVVLLFVIFGRKNRAKGFTLGKLLAGFGLFKMWKKD